MDISKVLDEAQKKLGISSDYALSKHTGIKKEYISMYRAGKRTPDAYACSRLADAIGVDPMELLAEVEAATERNPERRAYWEGKRKKANLDGWPWNSWRARDDSNVRPLPSEGSTLSS